MRARSSLHNRGRYAAVAGAMLGLYALTSPVIAQTAPETGEVEIELNKMEDDGEAGCRLSFVFRNGTEALFEAFKLDLVMFGKDDVIARRLIVDAGLLRPGKTTVKLFDLDGLPCADIATVLVNDLPACTMDGEARTDCVEFVATSSRADAALVK